MLALIGLYFLVPESPRWLIAVGRIDEAKAIIQKGAEINGKTLPDSVFAVSFVSMNKHPVQNQLLFHRVMTMEFHMRGVLLLCEFLDFH